MFAHPAFPPPPPGQHVVVQFYGGCTYTGEWRNGKMHGKGTLTFPPPDDGQYRGEFRDGVRHGQGTLQRPRHPSPGRTVTDADGTYTGEWFKNVRQRLSSPLTNQNLKSAELTPNHTLKKFIADFLATQKKRDESLAKVVSMEMEIKRARDRMVERDMREQERANATSAAAAALLSAERTRMQEKLDEEKAKVASMEMEMKRARDWVRERVRHR